MSRSNEEIRVVGEDAAAANRDAPAKTAAEAGVAERLAALEARLAALEPRTVSNKASFMVTSGDYDKIAACLVLAMGSASMGLEVTLFHGFWGITALRKGRKFKGKTLKEKALSAMLPGGFGDIPASRLPFLGAGTKLMRAQMKEKKMPTLDEMYVQARELGVKFEACPIAMSVMGITEDEFIDGVVVTGAASFLAEAADSKITMFI